jgi:acetylornithine deacetylase/succinyl-diaminopimelate desuccinylase-like protein
MRLVPNQDPAKIAKLFEKTLIERCPKHTKIEVVCHSHTGPVLLPIDSRPTQLAAKALEKGFGVKPTFMREGGSIPVSLLVKKELGINTLFVGFGLADDRVHSPNEKFDLDALHKGTRTAAALYDELSRL